MTKVVVRPAVADEMPLVQFNAARQMGMTTDNFTGMAPDWTICAFADGELATTYAAWPLTIRWDGEPVRMAGVTWVSTHPAHRRRGYLRQVVNLHFQRMHEERDVALAGLHPAWVAIYQRYGYGLITTRTTYRLRPEDLRFAHPMMPSGRIRELRVESEFPLLVDVYRRYREDRTGLVHRGRAMWDAGPLAPPARGFERLALVYEEGGIAMGYVIVTTGPGPALERAGPGLVMTVEDIFALNPAASYALWGALASFDNVREIIWRNAPPDDPLPNMVVEPRMLNATTRDGIMVRLVTVEDALRQRPYAEDAVLRFELADAVCPWNAGRWELVAGPGGAEVRRTNASADLALTADALAAISWGRLTTTRAAAAGLVSVDDASALPRWDRLFATKHAPHEAEHTW